MKKKLKNQETFMKVKPRINLSTSFNLKSKNIGSKIIFDMNLKNISKSGILASSSDKIYPLPFTVNTLLELNFDSYRHYLNNSLESLGKVIRRVDLFEQNKTLIGIQIVHLDQIQKKQWEDYVDKIVYKNQNSDLNYAMG